METNPTGSPGMKQFKDAPSPEAHVNKHQAPNSHCGTDAARARWTILRQVTASSLLSQRWTQGHVLTGMRSVTSICIQKNENKVLYRILQERPKVPFRTYEQSWGNK